MISRIQLQKRIERNSLNITDKRRLDSLTKNKSIKFGGISTWKSTFQKNTCTDLNSDKRFPLKPLFSIVMPVFNGKNFLEESILSILSQDYENIEIIIIDGGSTDGSIEILRKFEQFIDLWISEPDSGMYDAIHKGFCLSTGEIYSWLNSDDIYFKGALTQVNNIFQDRSINWITGIPNSIDNRGHHIGVEHPKHYPKILIRYGFFKLDCLGSIQQESTFFRSTLYHKEPLNTKFNYAGDFHLWCGFARHEKLYTLKTLVAAFRIHPDQKSKNQDLYLKECEELKIPGIIAFFKRFIFTRSILKISTILLDFKLLKIKS